MQASEFAVRLLLLFFPGVICAYIVDALTIHRPRTQFFFFIDSLVLGLASYFLYWSVLRAIAWCGGNPPEFVFLRALTDGNTPVAFREVAWATLTAATLGLGVTFVSSGKLHFRFARWIGITNKFGELDVWGFVFNSPEVEWATVRDYSRNLAYDGWVQLFSDDSQNAELLLQDVHVYKNDSGERLYDISSLYLALDRNSISIEFRSSQSQREQAHAAATTPAGDSRGNGEEGRAESEADDTEARTAAGPGWLRFRNSDDSASRRETSLARIALHGGLRCRAWSNSRPSSASGTACCSGLVDRDRAAELYASADVFVMPSVSEPFGIVPLEAMDRGVPVIVSRQSGVSEVLNHALKVDCPPTVRNRRKRSVIPQGWTIRATTLRIPAWSTGSRSWPPFPGLASTRSASTRASVCCRRRCAAGEWPGTATPTSNVCVAFAT